MKKTLLLLLVTSIFCGVAINAAYADDNGTEFGIEDDLTVLGTGGTTTDPDAEIKGFTVFGATQVSYSPIAIPIGAGNVIINGYLGVSSGAYFVGGSTFSANQGAYFLGISSFSDVGKIYVGGSGAANNRALLYDGNDGSLKWGDVSTLVSGDNLGNHTATITLDMNTWDVNNVSTVTFLANVYISSASATNYGGIYISTHIYSPGDIHANKFYGDGSGLTNIPGAISGTPNRLQKIDGDGSGLVDAAIVQSGNGDSAGLTVVASSFSVNNVAIFKSSVTINGDGTNGLNVAGGASTFAGDVTANASLNVGNGGTTDIMTVNGSGTAGTKFVVFKSNGSDVAWMRKK